MENQRKKQPYSSRLAALSDRLAGQLSEEERLLLAQAAQTALRLESGEGFSCEPVVSMRNGRPLIDCTWMGMLAQITPSQAREIALGLIEAAIEAESDVAISTFLQDTGIPPEKVAGAIYAVRQLRHRQRLGVVGEKQEPASVLRPPFGKPS